MNNTSYARACTEVLEVIKHFSEEDYKKIPKSEIEFYEKNKDNDYEFSINPNISLRDQNISVEANSIIVTIFRDYFATEVQKEKLERLLRQNQDVLDAELREKYNPDNIFKNNKPNKVTDETIHAEENKASENMQIIEYKESFIKRIIGKILKFFKRN